MEKEKIISSIAKRGNGEIYLGVVGAVRTGKSTFIKRFIENLVVPSITDEYEKKHCLDEIPQSAQGKTIMTTEPKFVPSNGATIKVGEFETNIKLVDCVGYVIPEANGFVDEDGNPRMVKSPWFEDAIPFVEAAEIGTEKVIKDHATIGIVVTTDGSFGEIKRNSYIEAEEKVIGELKNIGKPFIVILNSVHPTNTETQALARNLSDTYEVPVMPISAELMNEKEIMEILKTALFEFPVLDIKVSIPEWVHVLSNKHEIKAHYLEKIRESVISVEKVKDIDDILNHFNDSSYISDSYISELDAATGTVTINLESTNELFESTLKSIMGDMVTTKAGLLKIFASYTETKEEMESLKQAVKMAKSTGYGIVYPGLKELKLETPELVKQGNRYGVKLKAVAPSIHMIRVDVNSTFEPIIGSKEQAEAFIQYLQSHGKNNKEAIFDCDVFGRKLGDLINEGMRVKLASMNETACIRVHDILSKIVNKGKSNVIAIVL